MAGLEGKRSLSAEWVNRPAEFCLLFRGNGPRPLSAGPQQPFC